LLKQMTTAFKGSILCDFGSYNNDLSRVLPRVRNFIGESEPPDQGARYPEREAFYVGLLTQLHELSKEVENESLAADQVQDWAALFVELDTELNGWLSPSDVGYFLHRLGRSVPARDMVKLLGGFVGDGDRGGLDFLEVVELAAGLWHSECELLSMAYDELSNANRQGDASLHKSVDLLHTCGITLPKEQVKLAVEKRELLLTNEGTSVRFQKSKDLFELVGHCRDLERERFLERAGFSFDEVTEMRNTFDEFEAGRISANEQQRVLRDFGAVQWSPVAEPNESSPVGVALLVVENEDAGLAFLEFIHLARRLIYHDEFSAMEIEQRAFAKSGLREDECAALRKLYDALVQEGVHETTMTHNSLAAPCGRRRYTVAQLAEKQDAVREEFSYGMLAKSVRFFGVSLTKDQDAQLQVQFKEHAQPSQKSSRLAATLGTPVSDVARLHLGFPGFLLVMGWLWHTDFAGVRTAATRRCAQSGGSEEKSSSLAHLARQLARIVGLSLAKAG